jgi:hypothetical protein
MKRGNLRSALQAILNCKLIGGNLNLIAESMAEVADWVLQGVNKIKADWHVLYFYLFI